MTSINQTQVNSRKIAKNKGDCHKMKTKPFKIKRRATSVFHSKIRKSKTNSKNTIKNPNNSTLIKTKQTRFPKNVKNPKQRKNVFNTEFWKKSYSNISSTKENKKTGRIRSAAIRPSSKTSNKLINTTKKNVFDSITNLGMSKSNTFETNHVSNTRTKKLSMPLSKRLSLCKRLLDDVFMQNQYKKKYQILRKIFSNEIIEIDTISKVFDKPKLIGKGANARVYEVCSKDDFCLYALKEIPFSKIKNKLEVWHLMVENILIPR